MSVTSSYSTTGGKTTKYNVTLTADTDEFVIPVIGMKQFSMQTEGITADEIKLYFTNDDTNYVQWVDSSGVNPWTADDIATLAGSFSKAKIVRSGAADGDITCTFIAS